MEASEKFRKWHQSWICQQSTKLAYARFDAIGGVDSANTKEKIVQACFNAAHYKPEVDPGQIYRDKLRAEKKKRDQLARAAHVLALSAGRNETAIKWACLRAELESGVCIRQKETQEQSELTKVVGNYLLNLEKALRAPLPELDGGPWLNKFTLGNLILNDAISAGRPITTESMLAFELVFYLRLHTASRACERPQNGQPMPTEGKPCYPVVAAFCLAVFGGSHTPSDMQDRANQISDNVRKLKMAGLSNWPEVIN